MKITASAGGETKRRRELTEGEEEGWGGSEGRVPIKLMTSAS